MTEQELLGCDKPHPMLIYLRGRVSNRKLRLYACACCRRVWGFLQDGRSRRAVDVAEQYADGLTSYRELKSALGGHGLIAARGACGRSCPSSCTSISPA
jgi:hypothetical protein